MELLKTVIALLLSRDWNLIKTGEAGFEKIHYRICFSGARSHIEDRKDYVQYYEYLAPSSVGPASSGSLRVLRVAANILNKQSRAAALSILGIGLRIPCSKKVVCYETSQRVSDFDGFFG
jgi:hypothetical protein